MGKRQDRHRAIHTYMRLGGYRAKQSLVEPNAHGKFPHPTHTYVHVYATGCWNLLSEAAQTEFRTSCWMLEGVWLHYHLGEKINKASTLDVTVNLA